jgi:tetratricopeptide (TPR) repeat protein
MKALLILLFSVSFFINVSAQDINALIKESNRLESVPNESAAFNKFKEILKLEPTNIYALNKCSELCSRIGKRQTDKKVVNDYYEAAKTYAGIALRIDPNNAESNCVMAIALGRSSLNKSGKEKIISAREIKVYVDKAIKNDPLNFKAWHVLGRWNYELGNLNFIERTAAKLLYGNIPEGSVQDAIAAFEKSNSISDGFILNYFELAKAYSKNDEKSKAINTITKMLLIPNHTEDDPAIKEDARRLLKDIQ